jgi:hypothetical protein
MKRFIPVISLLGCLCLIMFLSVTFYSPMPLYNLITGFQVADFFIIWPKIRILIEPFYSFAFYALTLNRNFYLPAITSWILWVVCIVLVYCLVNKKNSKQILINIFYSLMIVVTVFSFVVLIPVPGPKLEKPQGYIAVDIHSHTVSSGDNVAPAQISVKAHLWAGFDGFFNTEHNHTQGFALFPKDLLYKTVYPGMQIQTRDKVSVILLASEAFDCQVYKNMTLADIIKKAHENKLLVIMPHWWKWHQQTFSELKALGIDGFEIYNCGYRNFNEIEQREMINFAEENELLMFGSTDWHGWGYMTDTWTVFRGDISENIQEQLANKPQTQVILYRQKQSDSILRFIFEPFFAFYYYIKNANTMYVASFMFWIVLSFVVFRSRLFKYIKKYLPLFMALIYGFGIIYFCIIVRVVSDTNEIIMDQIVPILVAVSVLWIILWRSNKKINA